MGSINRNVRLAALAKYKMWQHVLVVSGCAVPEDTQKL
jgi:hypothetical protein